MSWLAWRQFRTQASAAVAALALLVGVLALLVRGLADEYAAGIALCGNDCREFADRFLDHHQGLLLALILMALVVPALIGLFWGAPLVAREFEVGTDRMVWNQTISRERWLTTKLLVIGVATVAVAGLASLALGWAAGPLDEAAMLAPRLSWGVTFMTRDVVPVAYAVFAFVLGVVVGMVARRVLAAMVVTLIVLVTIQVGVSVLARPHLVPPVTATFTIAPGTVNGFRGATPGGEGRISATAPEPGAWLISSHTIDADGNRVETVPLISPACDPGQEMGRCFEQLGELGYRLVSTYHPHSHYWPLQRAETALYAALTAAVVGLGYWQLRHRIS